MEIDPKLRQYESLMSKDWLVKLQPFLLSDNWTKIKNAVNASLTAKIKLTPTVPQMFNAFKYTPFDKTRVVIVGQNPYPQADIATGIAFESSSKRLPESLKYIYDAIEEDLYEGFNLNMERSHDLKYLCEQGVLLLNTSLTTPVGVTDVDKKWQPFTTEVLNLLNKNHTGLIFCFWGKEAQSYHHLINDKIHHKLYCSHPASGWHNGGVWKCNNFSEVNKILHSINGEIILWDKYYYDLQKTEIPF